MFFKELFKKKKTIKMPRDILSFRKLSNLTIFLKCDDNQKAHASPQYTHPICRMDISLSLHNSAPQCSM